MARLILNSERLVAAGPRFMPYCNLVIAVSGCRNGYPQGYTPAASGASKAYRMWTHTKDFNQAKQACQNEGSVLAMPRNVEDISDMKTFNRKYSLFNSI